jgi:hypothetical protein
MPRMRSRTKWPPRNDGLSGWRFTQPQTQWSLPPNLDFVRARDAIINHRQGNPWLLTEHKLSLDPEQVGNELDSFEAHLMMSEGYLDFIVMDDLPKIWRPQRVKRPVAAAVVQGAKNTAAGISLVKDWIGDGLTQVEQNVAEDRAVICAGCPVNGDPNFLENLTGAASEELKALMEVRHDMKLSTAMDDQLHTCKACGCALKLKVWTPLKHIVAHLKDDVKSQLDPRCWVLKAE